MSIEAINEQLLRAVGVGIALFNAETLELRFQNDIFVSWFEGFDEGTPVTDIFPKIDLPAMRSAIETSGRFTTELRVQKKRRTLAIAQVFSRTEIGNEIVLVLECQNITRIRELELMIESYSTMVERNTREIQREKEQVEKLLLNIMPRAAYEEYKSFGVVAPQKYPSVSVLILDFAGFNETIDQLAPADFVGELNELYSAFDRIGEQFACERIKTTGDTYLCVAGMHDPTMDHAMAIANASIRFIRYLNRRNDNAETRWDCRIGIAEGSVVGSVVGVQKYVYDIFGDAVNSAVAARSNAASLEVLVAEKMTNLISEGLKLIPPQSAHAREMGIMALQTNA